MDGFGCGKAAAGNAIAQAKLPCLHGLMQKYPHSYLDASGEAVGLPDGQIGNSEVGHLNIGAGRIVYQELTRITKDIRTGAFFEKPVLVEAMKNAVEKGTALHIMAQNAQVVLFGIGRADTMVQRRRLNAAKQKALKDSGACGEALGSYCDLAGNIVHSTSNVGVALTEIQRNPHVLRRIAGTARKR